jgi:predicted ABC-type ATPase
MRWLREALELDSLPRIEDSRLAKNLTMQFLLPANGQKQNHPQLIGIGGGPGAGKSFLYDLMKAEGTLVLDAVIHDPDVVMQSIPQYRDEASINPVAAFKKWELPARQLANEILLKALLARYNIIYMRTFALPDSLHFVRAAKTCGYQFDAHMVTCDLEIALKRAKEREKITKRHIPLETIAYRHESVLRLIPDIMNIADSYFIYENNHHGSCPLLKNHSIKREMHY